MGKIRFMEESGIKEYDSVADALIIQKKLEKIASEIDIPVFHKGNLEPDFLESDEFKVSDSLRFTIERRRYDSQGSGTFVSGNLADVMDWNNNFKSDTSMESLYLLDLGIYKDKLLEIENDDFSDKYSEFLEKISSFIMYEITEEPSKYLPESIDCVNKMYEHCQKPLEHFGISKEMFEKWVDNELERVRNAIYHDICSKEHSINTSFQKECMKIGGINLSKAAFDDSIARGSIIFDIDKKRPFIVDFGSDEGLAKEFFGKIYTKVLTPKMKEIDERDIKPLLYNYQEALPFAPNTKEFAQLERTMTTAHKGFITAKYIDNVAKAYKINVDYQKIERAVMDKILSIKEADMWKTEIERRLEEMYGIDVGNVGFVNKYDDPLVKERMEDLLETELGIDVGKTGFRNKDNDPRYRDDEEER